MSPPPELRSANRLWLIGSITAAWILWGCINVFRLGAIPGITWTQAVWYGFPDALIWLALTPLVVAFARRQPIRQKGRFTALGLHVAAAVVFALVHAAADACVATVRDWIFGTEPHWLFVFFKVLRWGFQMNLLVYALVAGLALYIEYQRHLARGERRAAALQAQLIETRLAGLERQLRPHFLFNALNTVSGLMGGDAATGRRVVRRLGELLRAGLEGKPGHRIALREELDLARAYLEIEQVRFADRLRVTIEVEPSNEALRESTLTFPVPHLILQPLVENAIRHGIARREDGGHIRVHAEQQGDTLQLTVEDGGAGLPASARDRQGFGIGLAATRQRLAALYGESAADSVILEPMGPDPGAGTRVRLTVPRGSEVAT